MTAWDVATWLAIAVLGPGALVVFVAFLRDLLRPAAPEAAAERERAPGPLSRT
jgi:hypothetical protein